MKNLIVFDFDWSLSDADSDNYAICNLNENLKQVYFNALEGTKEGYLAVDDLFLEVHNNGFYKEELLTNLKKLPINPSTIELIKKSKELGHNIVIISDSNDLFINQILSNYGILNHIDLILTNRVIEERDRRLRLVPFKHPVNEAHNCTNALKDGTKMCNMNLCKGKELKELMTRKQYNKVIYIGDGKNDFCPMLQLRSQDVMCIRKARNLEKLYHSEKTNFNIQSKVEFWNDGNDLYKTFESSKLL